MYGELIEIKSRIASSVTHHDSVFLLAREFGLVNVLETVGLGVFGHFNAFILAKSVEWMSSRRVGRPCG
jgi:hypothetical protein